MAELVTAGFTTAFTGTPSDIIYIPEGKSDITPYVGGKPKRITVNVPPEKGREIAAKLQTDLEQRQSQNVRPWIDFEHKNGKSAGNPTRFDYVPGQGIIVAIDWSNSGKNAIEGKDYSYFSPSFLPGDNGIPLGLDSTGPIGGLVNEPAFRQIPRIAAKAGKLEEPTEPQETMSKLIFAKLGIDPANADAETSAVSKIEAMSGDKDKLDKMKSKLDAMTAEYDKIKKKMEGVEAQAAQERKDRAESLVNAAQADGRIAPKDEETAKGFREKIEAGDTFAESILGKLPKTGPNGQVINASNSANSGDKTQRIEAAQGKARAELGSSAPFENIWERAQEIDADAFV